MREEAAIRAQHAELLDPANVPYLDSPKQSQARATAGLAIARASGRADAARATRVPAARQGRASEDHGDSFVSAPSEESAVTLPVVRDLITQSLITQSARRGASLADAAMSSIRGTTDAQRLMATIRAGCAPADAMLDGMVQVLQLGDPDRTRGFFRELQKALERRA